jgi:hypothetical protein
VLFDTWNVAFYLFPKWTVKSSHGNTWKRRYRGHERVSSAAGIVTNNGIAVRAAPPSDVLYACRCFVIFQRVRAADQMPGRIHHNCINVSRPRCMAGELTALSAGDRNIVPMRSAAAFRRSSNYLGTQTCQPLPGSNGFLPVPLLLPAPIAGRLIVFRSCILLCSVTSFAFCF